MAALVAMGAAGGRSSAGQSNPGVHEARAMMVSAANSTESTSAMLPEAPEAIVTRNQSSGMKVLYQTHLRPFSQKAIAVKVGLEGIGIEVATPLSNKWNLRAGASFLNATANVTVNETGNSTAFGVDLQSTIDVAASPRFRSVSASADWFPWYGSFRVSPGITLYNGNHGTAIATVPGGQTISVGNGTYTSDPADPIRAYATVTLGHTVAPRLTVGWGNMIPRTGKHFSFPFEIGVEYVGRPVLQLTLTGSECDTGGACFPVAIDPTTQANLNQQQQQINDDIAPLRFYPLLTTGVSYRF